MRPTATMWADIKERDGDQCAATGARVMLTHQHRRSVGMGGSKTRPTFEDSLTLSAEINDRCERDLQIMALAYGWKVRRWVKDPGAVPVFYPTRFGWARLTPGGEAIPITPLDAARMMRDVYGDQWDEWMNEIDCETPNGLAVEGRSGSNG
ncbi:hypothetical protein [Leucobacter sp. GX24907]